MRIESERGERLGEVVLEEFGEFLDLTELIGHALARLAAVVGDPECAQPRSGGRNEVGFCIVVRMRDDGILSDRGWVLSRRDGLEVKAGGAVGFSFELSGLRRGEEVGVEKGGTEQRVEVGEGFGGREVFGDVAGGVAPDEGKMGTSF